MRKSRMIMTGVLTAFALVPAAETVQAQVTDPGQRLIRRRAEERVRQAGQELHQAVQELEAEAGAEDGPTTGSENTTRTLGLETASTTGPADGAAAGQMARPAPSKWEKDAGHP